jgi:hypothetical protein
MEKTIEVTYRIQDIPGTGPDGANSTAALDFRNAAMELIEAALEAENTGEWEGADIGMGEVSFGFMTNDPRQAENIIWRAVSGTPYERNLTLRVISYDDPAFAEPDPATRPRLFQLLLRS